MTQSGEKYRGMSLEKRLEKRLANLKLMRAKYRASGNHKAVIRCGQRIDEVEAELAPFRRDK